MSTIIGPGSTLTRRRLQCLQLKADGLDYAQIAEQLGISRSTVKARLGAARDVLGARSIAQAAGLAYLRGLVK